MLYLYFASNANGFVLALSPAAIRQTIGMPPQTYRDQFLKLVDKGYLVQMSSNRYAFYETPQPKTPTCTDNGQSQNTDKIAGASLTPTVVQKTQVIQCATGNNTEIYINNKNKTYTAMEKQVSPSNEFVF